MSETLEQKIDALAERVEDLHDRLDLIEENDERLAEAIANLSLPGSNYSIDRLED